jgi:uncharacterized protein (TIGR02996 family)
MNAEAFLADVLEHPDDDTPRLVYADWLEDHGQAERAEFIRTQCQLAQVDEFDDRRPELLWRQTELFRLHGVAWSKPLLKFTKRVEFVRGFIGRMTLTGAKFLKSAGDVFARTPLREVRLLQADARTVDELEIVDELAACEALARLRALDLHSCRLGAARTVTLMGSPFLAGLEELNLGHVHCRLGGARAVCAAEQLGGLRTLYLNNNDLADDVVPLLAGSRPLRQLTRLSLAHNRLSAAGVEALTRIEHLSGLVDLDLSENVLGDEGAISLAGSDRWQNLRRLSLGGTAIGRDGARALAGSPHLAGLRNLELEGLQGSDGLGDLAAAPHLTNLRALDLLHWPMVDDDDVRAFVESPLLPRLRMLRMPRMSLEGARLLLRSPASAGLWHLSFAACRLGPELGDEIAAATHLTQLTNLDLRHCGLQSAGLTALVQAPHLARLVNLGVAYNGITEPGYQALLHSPHLHRLRRIVITGNPSDPAPATWQGLQERFGEDCCDTRFWR